MGTLSCILPLPSTWLSPQGTIFFGAGFLKGLFLLCFPLTIHSPPGPPAQRCSTPSEVTGFYSLELPGSHPHAELDACFLLDQWLGGGDRPSPCPPLRPPQGSPPHPTHTLLLPWHPGPPHCFWLHQP